MTRLAATVLLGLVVLTGLLALPAVLAVLAVFFVGSGLVMPNASALALDRLTHAVRLYDDAAIGPYWAEIQASLDADRAMRAHIMAANGVAGLLASVSPRLRWDPPVLHWYAHDVRPDVPRDIFLGGRGLVLSPSLFVKDQGALRYDDPNTSADFAYPLLQGPASDRAWCPRTRAASKTARIR